MRLFTALELPPDVKQHAAQVMARLKPADAPIKWVRPEGMHLTLKFLGEVEPAALPACQQALERACAGLEPLELAARGCGAFPSPRQARVVWLGIGGAVAELRALAEKVDMEYNGLGFAREKRAFSAHITLGRLRAGRGKPGPLAPLAQSLAGMADLKGPAFTARQVLLMESHLSPAGARYTPLHQIDLGPGSKQNRSVPI